MELTPTQGFVYRILRFYENKVVQSSFIRRKIEFNQPLALLGKLDQRSSHESVVLGAAHGTAPENSLDALASDFVTMSIEKFAETIRSASGRVSDE